MTETSGLSPYFPQFQLGKAAQAAIPTSLPTSSLTSAVNGHHVESNPPQEWCFHGS